MNELVKIIELKAGFDSALEHEQGTNDKLESLMVLYT